MRAQKLISFLVYRATSGDQVTECQQFSLALLTSDGVHEYVDLDFLEATITGEGSLRDKCEEIIQRAINAGSEDDISVVIICPSEE